MKPRVLVVDDEEAIVVGLTALLAAEDLETAGAFDRMSAEAMIRGTFYAVIVADVRLHSEEEGIGLLEDIKRLSPRSKVISITGFATPELESEVRQRGSSTFIRKPAEPGEIIAAVFDLLGEIEKLAGGDEALDLEHLHSNVRKLLYSIPQRKFGLSAEEAEDVVQEAWLLFLEKRSLIRTAPAWLAGTVLNLCRRQLERSRRSRERFEGEDVLESMPDMHAGISEETITVSTALQSLDKKSQMLCHLIAIEGYSYDEVSSMTGLPLGSVGPMYIRAKKKLRTTLEN
jgi:RNA polymerase sigma factor (sigma-70 family)